MHGDSRFSQRWSHLRPIEGQNVPVFLMQSQGYIRKCLMQLQKFLHKCSQGDLTMKVLDFATKNP